MILGSSKHEPPNSAGNFLEPHYASGVGWLVGAYGCGVATPFDQ